MPEFVKRHLEATHKTVKTQADLIERELTDFKVNTELNLDRVAKAFDKLDRDIARAAVKAQEAGAGFKFAARDSAELVLAFEDLHRAVIQFTQSKVTGQTEEAFLKLGETFQKVVDTFEQQADRLGFIGEDKIRYVTGRVKQAMALPGVDEATKAAWQQILGTWQDAQNKVIAESERTTVTVKDHMDRLAGILGDGFARTIATILQAVGKLNAEVIGRFTDVVDGVTTVIGALPGRIGDKLRNATNAITDWVNRIDAILRGLHKIFNQIPDGLGAAIEAVLGHFKKAQQTVITTTDTMKDKAKEAATGVGQATGDMGKSATEAGGTISKAFGVAASAVGAFVSGLSTAAATGSKAMGALVGGIQGALSGFATGGPIGAVIGGIGGVLGGLFGGKSAAQKQQEKLQLERLKQDVQKGAQEVMQAAFDTIEKAIQAFENLADFTKVPKRVIEKFFSNLRTVIDAFITLSRGWSVSMLDAAKKFAESVGPVLEAIGAGVEAFEKLSFYTGTPERAITAFGVTLERAFVLFVEIAERFPGKVEKAAKKFAERSLAVVQTIGEGVTAFASLQDYKGIAVEVFDLFLRDLTYAVDKMNVIADDVDSRMLKHAAKFSARALAVVALIKEGLESFKGINDYKAVSVEIFDQFLADLKLAVVKMQAVVTQIDTEMLGMAQAFSQKSMAIFEAIKAGVESFNLLRDYKSIPKEALEAVVSDFKNAVGLLADVLDLALDGQALALAFRDAAIKIADALAKAGQALAGIGAQAAQAAAATTATAVVVTALSVPASAAVTRPQPTQPTTAHIDQSQKIENVTLEVNLSDLEDLEKLKETLAGLKASLRKK